MKKKKEGRGVGEGAEEEPVRLSLMGGSGIYLQLLVYPLIGQF